MKNQNNLMNFKKILIIFFVISQTFSAPTISTTSRPVEEKIDPCSIDELTEQLICKANDGDCVVRKIC